MPHHFSFIIDNNAKQRDSGHFNDDDPNISDDNSLSTASENSGANAVTRIYAGGNHPVVAHRCGIHVRGTGGRGTRGRTKRQGHGRGRGQVPVKTNNNANKKGNDFPWKELDMDFQNPNNIRDQNEIPGPAGSVTNAQSLFIFSNFCSHKMHFRKL